MSRRAAPRRWTAAEDARLLRMVIVDGISQRAAADVLGRCPPVVTERLKELRAISENREESPLFDAWMAAMARINEREA